MTKQESSRFPTTASPVSGCRNGTRLLNNRISEASRAANSIYAVPVLGGTNPTDLTPLLASATAFSTQGKSPGEYGGFHHTHPSPASSPQSTTSPSSSGGTNRSQTALTAVPQASKLSGNSRFTASTNQGGVRQKSVHRNPNRRAHLRLRVSR